MSDKFFFKGRQDARLNYCDSGYKSNAELKLGSQKNPLKLVVTNEERKDEVQAQLDEAGFCADILINSEDGAMEDIGAFTAILGKKTPEIREKTPSRNDPCLCGSGKKFKKCCG